MRSRTPLRRQVRPDERSSSGAALRNASWNFASARSMHQNSAAPRAVWQVLVTAVALWLREIGDRALIDPVRADDDAALRSLPEHLGEPHHWNGT
jgi:hypothetical protein